MNVLVTGGTGFLGRRLAAMLHAEGHSVRVLARRIVPGEAQLGIIQIRCDLSDAAAVAAAVAGQDAVMHVAARAGVWGSAEDFYQSNVIGTRNVIQACRHQGVSRLEYTSSPSVVFGREGIENGDEMLPYPVDYLAHYPRSKAVAEQLVLAANGTELDRPGQGGEQVLLTCALRPHLIWGVGDPHLVPRLLQAARARRLRQVGEGRNRVDMTHVDNAAWAHVLALRALRPGAAVCGQAYFIGDDEPVNLWDWVRDLLARVDAPPLPRRPVPYRMAYALGAVLEVVHRLVPLLGEPRMTRFVAAQFALSHYFSHAKAVRDFQYAPIMPRATGLAQVVADIRMRE